MSTTIVLANTSTSSQNYHFMCVFVVRNLKIYYLSNFQVRGGAQKNLEFIYKK